MAGWWVISQGVWVGSGWVSTAGNRCCGCSGVAWCSMLAALGDPAVPTYYWLLQTGCHINSRCNVLSVHTMSCAQADSVPLPVCAPLAPSCLLPPKPTPLGDPTQLFTSGHIGKSSDVYAYGILLYEVSFQHES